MEKKSDTIRLALPLKPGAKFGVCAPSARFDQKKFDKGVERIESMGFKLDIPDQIYGKKRYLAGNDRQRADIINHHFSDPGIDAVICARGGFGAMRVLPYLDWDVIRKNPKPFIGFSDATAILLTIIDKAGIPVLHGPTITTLSAASASTLDFFYQTLIHSSGPVQLQCRTKLLPADILHPVSSTLKGGNLSTISHLVGTPFQPDFSKSILFFEDVNEPAYKIDRMLTQMKLAGLFDRIQGVVTGSFYQCENASYIDEIMTEIFDDCSVPVFTGLPAGHGPDNLCLPMGMSVTMDPHALTISWNKS